MNRKNILIGGISMVLLAVLIYYLWQSDVAPAVYFTGGWIAAVLILLWSGNRFITIQFDKHFPWLSYGNKRFFTHLFLGILYSLIIINLAYLTFKAIFTSEPPTNEQLIVMNVYGIIMFIPVFSIYFSLHFLQYWKKSELNAEKFKKENIRTQLESLKNHLDPHFLFNNLNILSSLIDKDKNLSKAFLDNFAEVYRTILRSKDEDLIPLDEELNFIKSYMALLKTRFEDMIIFTEDIEHKFRMKMVPPMTLQMLVENAIKHNVISERKPLHILFKNIESEYFSVSNTLNKRPEELMDSSRSGLDNIRRRYAYFTQLDVKVIKTDTHFEVRVPLLEVETV
ncbi:histidine kinase [Fulvivirga ulvae]|uniref:sensor histidine kinase n=1 Tax=Fulvivirga ulvae TaxID=2904245 RepID=UPI001F3916F0|nr:histidine kinase [Fulvivirga ulvae]UII30177.1 histidine kinase [Fulvivirga ulvae]